MADFADDLLGSEEGVDMTRIGPATALLAQAVRDLGYDDAVTAGLLATMYWQSFILSPAYERAFSESDVLHTLDSRMDRMIVPHPVGGILVMPRFDMFVFAEGHHEDPVELDATISEAELASGWAMAQHGLMELRDLEPDVPSPATIAVDHYDALREAYEAASFRLALARRPDTVLTSAPNPAWEARVRPGDADFASAGLVARNADDVLGVTLPNHLFCPNAPAMPTAIGTGVFIRGVEGTIVSCDVITDSCFARLPRADRSPGILEVGAAGVMFQERVHAPTGHIARVASGAPPGHGSEATFTGALSSVQTVVVSGYDPFIYVPSRHIARCLYTDAATSQGDSGAALVDGRRRAVGFACERSAFDERPEWSSWIWAAAVMRAHGLRLLGDAQSGEPAEPDSAEG